MPVERGPGLKAWPSFMVEDIGARRLYKLTRDEIDARIEAHGKHLKVRRA